MPSAFRSPGCRTQVTLMLPEQLFVIQGRTCVMVDDNPPGGARELHFPDVLIEADAVHLPVSREGSRYRQRLLTSTHAWSRPCRKEENLLMPAGIGVDLSPHCVIHVAGDGGRRIANQILLLLAPHPG